ncbi:hypothetical protein D3C87_1546710 [compost metagenome]
MAVHFDATALTHQLAAHVLGIRALGNQGSQLCILAVLLFVAPAIEVEVHRTTLALPIDDKVGAGVAHPDIVKLGGDVGDVAGTANVFGKVPFAFAAEHGQWFVAGDGAGDAAECLLHIGGEIFPDGFLCAKGDEGALVLVALIGHVPITRSGGLQVQGHKAGGRDRAHAGKHRCLFDKVTTRRHGDP